MAEKTGKVNEEVAAEMSSLKAAEGGKSSKEESVEQLKNVFHWPPLESNPESMESYLYKVGLSKNWRFEEPIMILPEMLTPPNFNYKPVAAVACLQQKRYAESCVPCSMFYVSCLMVSVSERLLRW